METIIKIDDYKVISNVHQRKGRGGRPAIIVNSRKYVIENLTNTAVNIPWGVEIVWAVLTPKDVTNNSEVKKIVVASVYCKPGSRKKTLLLDHIAQVYNLLCSKYKRGLHWIICGDTNDLRLEPIINLSPNKLGCARVKLLVWLKFTKAIHILLESVLDAPRKLPLNFH